MTARCCVVVCYWVGRSPAPLYKLLRQMQSVPAGESFDVVIVCNGGDVRPFKITQPFPRLNIRVLNRPNLGWNLGAWDAGWRSAPAYDHYLFLQSECVIKAPDWLSRFVTRMELDEGIGMLGERQMWQNMTWDYIRAATEIDYRQKGPIPEGVLESIALYQRLLRDKNIDPGFLGTHLVSVILFTSRAVLEEVEGFPLFGEAYSEAVAGEIGMSRRICAMGYRTSQLSDIPFSHIGHPQWMPTSRFMLLAERVREKIYRIRNRL